MASISSDSKVTRSPSAANESKPASGPAQMQRAVAASAPPPSSASGFDPSSSFFPPRLPGSEAATTSPQHAASWGKWLWLLAAFLLGAGSSLYYVQRQAQDRSTPNFGNARAVDAAPSANAVRSVGREGPQPTAQGYVTHTLPGGAPPTKIPAATGAQDAQPVAAPASKAAAPLPAVNAVLPRVTHTQPSAAAGEQR